MGDITGNTLFKWLNNYGKGKLVSPQSTKTVQWELGVWQPPVEGKLKLCANGYHGAIIDDVLRWDGDRLFVMEIRGGSFLKRLVHGGEAVYGTGKFAAREARVVREIQWSNNRLRRYLADVLVYAQQGVWRNPPDIIIKALMELRSGNRRREPDWLSEWATEAYDAASAPDFDNLTRRWRTALVSDLEVALRVDNDANPYCGIIGIMRSIFSPPILQQLYNRRRLLEYFNNPRL